MAGGNSSRIGGNDIFGYVIDGRRHPVRILVIYASQWLLGGGLKTDADAVKSLTNTLDGHILRVSVTLIFEFRFVPRLPQLAH